MKQYYIPPISGQSLRHNDCRGDYPCRQSRPVIRVCIDYNIFLIFNFEDNASISLPHSECFSLFSNISLHPFSRKYFNKFRIRKIAATSKAIPRIHICTHSLWLIVTALSSITKKRSSSFSQNHGEISSSTAQNSASCSFSKGTGNKKSAIDILSQNNFQRSRFPFPRRK